MESKSKSPARETMLTEADGLCVRMARVQERVNGAEFFLSLLTETLESDRRIRSALQVREPEDQAMQFANTIKKDVHDALHQIGTLDAGSLRSHPKPGAD